MNYQEIKPNLAKANLLVSEGLVAEADALIRSMAGKGLTGADVSANLTPAALRKLRAFAKARKGN